MPPPRPPYTETLLSRPLPPLFPSSTATHNPPYSPACQSSIASATLHPLLESTLHLLNDDLFSAHFLVRKMEHNAIARWLHALLHAKEGDLRNARCWVRDCRDEVVAISYGSSGPDDGGGGGRTCRESEMRMLDVVGVLRGRKVEEVVEEYRLAKVAVPDEEGVEEIRRVKRAVEAGGGERERVEMEVRRERWRHLVNLLEYLEGVYGYETYDGTVAYDTKREKSQSSTMVLGEGWRRF